jgi:hypothetical protein
VRRETLGFLAVKSPRSSVFMVTRAIRKCLRRGWEAACLVAEGGSLGDTVSCTCTAQSALQAAPHGAMWLLRVFAWGSV